jgi:hypothetical protein
MRSCGFYAPIRRNGPSPLLAAPFPWHRIENLGSAHEHSPGAGQKEQHPARTRKDIQIMEPPRRRAERKRVNDGPGFPPGPDDQQSCQSSPHDPILSKKRANRGIASLSRGFRKEL